MAPEILEESLRAWEDPDFHALRESAEEIHTEWGLEDFDQERTVRVGRFDLLLRGREKRVVLDYKTSRPEKGLSPEGLNEWLEKQLRHDRPQLSAYAEMAARALSLPNEKIAWAVLFTALPRLVWGEPSNSNQQIPGSKQV